MRAGALRAVAARGLPVTVACSSACSASGGLWVARALARRVRAPGRSGRAAARAGCRAATRYVSLASRAVTRGGAGGATSRCVPAARRARASPAS